MKIFLTIFSFLFLLNVASAEAALFQYYPGNPVLRPDGSGFDSMRLYSPQIVKVNDIYYLYYAGMSGGNSLQVGLATSSDGITWDIHSNLPVLSCAEDTLTSCSPGGVWSNFRTVPETVMYEDGVFKMWYLGNNENLNAVNRLGYATSTDGFNWNIYKENPIFPPAPERTLSYINVIKFDGKYLLYFRNPVTDSDIHLATSDDGINWVNSPVAPDLPKDVTSISVINSTIVALAINSISTSTDGVNFGTKTGSILEYPEFVTVLEEGPVVRLWQSRSDGGPGSTVSIYLATTSLDKIVVASKKDKSLSDLIQELEDTLKSNIFSKAIRNSYFAHVKKLLKFYEDAQMGPAKNQLEALLKKLLLDNTQGQVGPDIFDKIRNISGEILEKLELSTPGTKEFPLMTQIASPFPPESSEWADDIYALGVPDQCGNTIGDCGCAITSLSMLAKHHGLNEGIDGQAINPGNLNRWLQENNGYSADGNVIWNYALQYFSDTPGFSRLTFDHHNAQSTSLIDSYVSDNQLAIAFKKSKGHYFVLTDVLGGGVYGVKDPYWYMTQTTADTKDIINHVQNYGGSVDQANLFTFHQRTKPLAGWIEIHLGSPAELLITDEEGRRAGYDPETGEVVLEIPGSSYSQAEGVVSQDSYDDTVHLAKVLMIQAPQDNLFTLEVIGTGVGDYDLTVTTSGGRGQYEWNHVAATTEPGQTDSYVIDVADEGGTSRAVETLEALAADKAAAQPKVASRLTEIADRLRLKNVARLFDLKSADVFTH